MTPEERAKELLRAMDDGTIGYSDAPNAVTAAIRDAENDALERAAALADEHARDYDGAAIVTAAVIRELKHEVEP